MNIDQITRVAVVGTSGYAGYLMDRLWELPDRCRVVAATSLDAADHPSVINCVNRQVRIFPDLTTLLSEFTPKECDAIVVSTGIDSHYRYVAEALHAGFHVLLEKPPVPTIQELDTLIRLQHEMDRVVAVHFQHLYDVPNQRLKQLLISRKLGTVRRVRAVAGWPRPVSYFQRSPWTGKLRTENSWVLDGTIANPLAHLLAQQLFFATTEPGLATPATVQAELYHANAIEGEDTSSLRITTTEGVEILFIASLAVRNQHDVLLEIETDHALVRQKSLAKTTIYYRGGREETMDTTAGSDADDERGSRLRMLSMIFDALQAGKPQPFDLATCRPYVVTLNAAFESNGLPRQIPEALTATLNSSEPQRLFVPDMESSLLFAFRNWSLFSEVGINWASPSEPFDCTGYTRFPRHRELISSTPVSLQHAIQD